MVIPLAEVPPVSDRRRQSYNARYRYLPPIEPPPHPLPSQAGAPTHSAAANIARDRRDDANLWVAPW
jgi:hypothetical protein